MKTSVLYAPTFEMGATLANGYPGVVEEGDKQAMIPLRDITVEKQIREEFEDEENSQVELNASIKKHGILQSVMVRPFEGGATPYKLVMGERRYRGAVANHLECIPAIIREMTDEQAAELQLAENIQRKNLTQLELAKRIQIDVDTLGVNGALEKHNKSRPWLSKIVSLLKLPPQAMRLLTEKITADLEVISMVKAVEKVDAKAAKVLVDELRATRGKADARKTAADAKKKVKPKATKGVEPAKSGAQASSAQNLAWPFPDGRIADMAAKANAAPSAGPVPAAAPRETLDRAYGQIFESGSAPNMVLNALVDADRAAMTAWLEEHYLAGRKANDPARAVMQGMRAGTFATDGAGAFAMIAFLHGSMTSMRPLDVVRVLSSVKA